MKRKADYSDANENLKRPPSISTAAGPAPQPMICGFPKVEFDRLSNDEQLRICRNVYGEEDVVMESPDFVEDKLRELEKGIDALPDKTKRDYLEAVDQEIRQQTNYIRSKDFLLMFLRADSFNTRCAALRLARFLVIKRDLFGAEKLPRRITHIDLDGDDKKLLLTGFLNNDCGVDKAGRVIIVSRRDLLKASSLFEDRYVKGIQRALFFIFMSTLENNIGAQKNGIVIISWNVDCTLSLHDFRKFAPMKMMYQSLPYKCAGMHQCYNNAVEAIIASWRKSLSGKLQSRLINHEGPPAYCLSKMNEYGIHLDCLPFDIATGKYTSEDIIEKLEKDFSSSVRVESGIFQLNQKSEESEEVERNSVVVTTAASHNIQCSIAECNPSKEKTKSKKRKEKTVYENKLPLRLMKVLNNNESIGNRALWWLPCGTAFAIDREKFADLSTREDQFSNELQGMKYSNFLRNLRRWGFRRLPDSSNQILKYHHPRFQKNSSSSDELLTTFTLSETQEMDMQSDSTRSRGGVLPKILMKILDSNKYTDSIWWAPDGKSFSIDTEQFSLDVLPTNFAGIKLESFLRTMRRWEFKKRGPAAHRKNVPDNEEGEALQGNKSSSIISFHHPLFRRSSPNLVDNWSCLDALAKLGTPDRGNSSRDGKLPVKLFKVLGLKVDDSSEARYQDIIWWLPEGKSFAIETKKFASTVLPEEFENIKWKSFRRSLCRWGFKRCSSHGLNAMAFHHPLFQKDAPELLETLVSCRNNANHEDGEAPTSEEAALVSADKRSEIVTSCQLVKKSKDYVDQNVPSSFVGQVNDVPTTPDNSRDAECQTGLPQNCTTLPFQPSQSNVDGDAKEHSTQQKIFSCLPQSNAQGGSSIVASGAEAFGLSSSQQHASLSHLNASRQSHVAASHLDLSELQRIGALSPAITASHLQNSFLQRALQLLSYNSGNHNVSVGGPGGQNSVHPPTVLWNLANPLLSERNHVLHNQPPTMINGTLASSDINLTLSQIDELVRHAQQGGSDHANLLRELLRRQQGNANNRHF